MRTRCAAALLSLAIVANAATPTITKVLTSYSFTPNTLSPGAEAAIAGSGFGTDKTTPVMVGGKAAYVSFASDTQFNIQIPVDAPLGPTTVTLGTSAPFNINLVQYGPAIPVVGAVFPGHVYELGIAGNSATAKAGDTISLLATGLGPTNPVLPTGMVAPGSPKYPTAATVTATIGGQPAAVSFAGLIPGQAGGVFEINLTVPHFLATGDQPVVVSVGGVNSEAGVNLPVVGTDPSVTSVVNGATYIPSGLPNAGIAQGAIMVIKGSLLGPATIQIDSNVFKDTSFSNTSINIFAGGQNYAALMYYTSAGQVAALLPSNVPAGPATLTVTYNGAPSNGFPINVVPNNLGIFTWTSDGQGAGIVTYPDYSMVSVTAAANCGGPYTACGAANPGDVLILWATGLGPINGSDAKGDGIGVNMPNIPLTLWLGGVAITPSYQGRGCCIGEDQIVFTVPKNVPTGCAVPLAAQIGNQISNHVVMPVAIGSRTCTASNPAFSAALVQQITASGGGTYGSVALRRNDNFPSPGSTDSGKATFARFSVPAVYRPFLVSYLDDLPAGTCLVTNSLAGNGVTPPFDTLVGLDAGAKINVQGPNGSQNIASQGGGTYKSNWGSGFLAPGVYTISSAGGADVASFTGSVALPSPPNMTAPGPDSINPIAVTRTSGLPLTWSGGSGNGFIQIQGYSATDSSYTNGAAFYCSLPFAGGSFTVPSWVTLALPAGNLAGLDFQPAAFEVSVPGATLNLVQLSGRYDSATTLVFK